MRRPLLLVLSLLAILVPTGIWNATGAVSAAPTPSGSGYWMLGSDGAVYAFGDAETLAGPAVGSAPAVDLEPTAAGDGYWVLDQRGRVHTYGAASHFGALRPADLVGAETATSMSATPAGQGYWIFTSRGRAIPFGDAAHHGDLVAITLNGPVLDSIPTPSGQGYYMVAADGGIFSFGDAVFHGSMGDTKLNAPVQSLVPDGDGVGYWLVASDGGIFSFEAPFKGSMGDTRLNKPVTGMVRYGDGYLMVAEDGGIFNFSDLPFVGSLGDKAPAQPIVAVAALRRESSPTTTTTGDSDATTTTTTGDSGTTTTTTTPQATTTTTSTVAAASLPAGEPTDVFDCEDGSGQMARLWYYGNENAAGAASWGADNQCSDRWIVLRFPGESVSDPYGSALSIAPGAQFNDEFGCPGEVCLSWTPDVDGSETISLAHGPMDGFTGGCPTGWSLWQVRAGANRPFEVYGGCPGADDFGWFADENQPDPDYEGPLCFHRQPDVIGGDEDDLLHAEDTNGDGDYVIIGNGGNDRFEHLSTDSMTLSRVFFCGGDGDDEARGWALLYDGGAGTDSAYLYDCHPDGRIAWRTKVESIHTGEYPCTAP